MAGYSLRKRIGVLALVLLAAVSAGVIYETWARYDANQTHPPPGEIVRMPWGASHLHCLGDREESEPTVLLQAGLDIYGSLSWAPIHESLSLSRRVCAYDRAGTLWSELNDLVRDGAAISSELDALLEAAGETPPYVMVGHSRGGLLSIIHAGLYAEHVQGLVLIDSSHFDPEKRLRSGTSSAERDAPPMWLVAMLARSGWLRVFDPYPYGDLPVAVRPARHFMTTSIEGFVAELSASERTFEQASNADLKSSLPVLVLSRGVPGKDPHSNRGAEGSASQWHELQFDLASLTDCGTAKVIDGTGHYVHHDRPAAVLHEIERFADRIAEGHSCRFD